MSGRKNKERKGRRTEDGSIEERRQQEARDRSD
jgi:hypothetical protein